jgi:hypothetical protein
LKNILKISPLYYYYNTISLISIYLELKIIYILIALSIFSSLIYLEKLELNFWNLNKNLRNNISKRGEEEVILKFNKTFYCFVKIIN